MNKILVSKMYSGEFLKKELGHECINFVKADNGKHYVFVNSHGVVAVEHYEHTVSAILLVKRIDKYTVSILAKVTPKVLDEDMLEFLRCKDREQQKTKIKKYIADNGIAYTGVSLNDMFDDKDAECSFSPISYEVEQMYLPKNELYLTKDKTHKDKENYIYFSEGTIAGRDHWFYCEKDETTDAFSAITKYLNDEKLWEKFTPPALEVEDTPYFISILRKEYDEICYSNMFKHFFCIDRNVFKKFAKEILKIDISTDYTVEREKCNMDLLIQDNRNIIVIENKINSGVNGRKPVPGNEQNETMQFAKSQFIKYQEKAMEIANEKGLNEENTHLFIFFPDHNKSDWSKFTSEKWEQIKYSRIHKFYEENKIDCKYFEEFLYALKLHKGESSDFKSEIMHIRLMNMLKERRR